MKLRGFVSGRYDAEYTTLQNELNAKQELLTNDEFAMTQFLHENQEETLLSLLLPNIGIAKKEHIDVCLRTISKLRQLELIDIPSLFGRTVTSETRTLEVGMLKQKLRFDNLHFLASFFLSVTSRIFSFFGPWLLQPLLYVMALASLLIPLSQVTPEFVTEHFSLERFFLFSYLTIFAALSWRSAVQAAFLRCYKQRFHDPKFGFQGLFLAISADNSAVNLLGIRRKVQLALVGLLAPLSLATLFIGLGNAQLMPLMDAYNCFTACVAVFLALACPVWDFDGASLLDVVFKRNNLRQTLSQDLCSPSPQQKDASYVLGLGIFACWLVLWFDCAHSYCASLIPMWTARYFYSNSINAELSAGLGVFVVSVAFLSPLFWAAYRFFLFRRQAQKNSKRVDRAALAAKPSLEEQLAALEKIPLFTILNDSERLALFQEMEAVFFIDGAHLVTQGEIGQEFFVLVRGRVKTSFKDASGKQYPLGTLSEGDAFGEIALIDDVPRTASILSDGGCMVLVLKKDAFARFAATLGSPERIKQMIRLSSFFRRHPLFSRLSAKDQAALIDAFHFQTLMPGEEVSRSNDDEDNFFVIYAGRLRVDTGDDAADLFLEADDCFGYTNFFSSHYYAVEGTGLLSIKTSEFNALIWDKLVAHPELFLQV